MAPSRWAGHGINTRWGESRKARFRRLKVSRFPPFFFFLLFFLDFGENCGIVRDNHPIFMTPTQFQKNNSRPVAYTSAPKERFHREGKELLKYLAAELGIEGDIRSNKGGIAVSGEVTFHGDSVYMQLSQPALSGGKNSLLIRSCKGRKDFAGGTNYVRNLSDGEESILPLIKRCAEIGAK